jgi:hypothetical protein
MQKRGQLIFDGLGFGLGPGEAQQVVVGIAGIPEPTVTGVAWVTPRQVAPLLAQFPGLRPVTAPSRPRQCVAHLGIRRVLPAARPWVWLLYSMPCLPLTANKRRLRKLSHPQRGPAQPPARC